jgi:hypothetical protein
LLICKPFSDYSGNCRNRTVTIIATQGFPIVIPELIFRQIAMQMLFTTMLIDALHATLENAEIALNRVAVDRWHFIIDILTGAVVSRAVRRKFHFPPGLLWRNGMRNNVQLAVDMRHTVPYSLAIGSIVTALAGDSKMAKWIVTCTSATPPMFYELQDGKKTLAMVRCVTGKYVKRAGKVVYQHHYQVVRKWHGLMGMASGPVFNSLSKAKRHAEGSL